MEKTFSPQEISVIYEQQIRRYVKTAIEACLAASDNPINRYELIQCMLLATFKDLSTAAMTLNPQENMKNFTRKWTESLVMTVEQHGRQQREIDRLKNP